MAKSNVIEQRCLSDAELRQIVNQADKLLKALDAHNRWMATPKADYIATIGPVLAESQWLVELMAPTGTVVHPGSLAGLARVTWPREWRAVSKIGAASRAVWEEVRGATPPISNGKLGPKHLPDGHEYCPPAQFACAETLREALSDIPAFNPGAEIARDRNSKAKAKRRCFDRDHRWLEEFEKGEWDSRAAFAQYKKQNRDTMSRALDRAIEERESAASS